MNTIKYWQLKFVALFLTGILLTTNLFPFMGGVTVVDAQESNACAMISQPLTPEEENWARVAWQYFLNNYQPATGLTNSTNNYPSGTLWDMGNYLMALNSARWLNLITQQDFDMRLNKFLQTLSGLKLFEDSLPHKVYNTATGAMVDYNNNPVDRGIGWSALDIGRILAAFHVLKTCHPQYSDWLNSIVNRWAIARSLKDGMLYGAMVKPDGQTMLVQEGRLGYEEYAARGYQLWGFSAAKALSFEPFKLVEIYGVKIPADTRDFQTTKANNYVVSESYILDGIEFGFLGEQMQQYAKDVLEVQRRRFLATGQLTAVTEDNIDGPPYFLYNTVYANGKPWATITEKNEPYPDLATISTKAAIGWHYIYPNDDYAQKLLEKTNSFISPDGGGFFAGEFEKTKELNKSLTGNTNGLILEILYYKARGNRPLIENAKVSVSTGKPEAIEVMKDYPPPSLTEVSPPQGTNQSNSSGLSGNLNSNSPISVQPIPSLGNLPTHKCYATQRALTPNERRYATAAWNYFETNFEPNTGLVRDRADMNATNLWGMGDYLSALESALALGIIEGEKFDRRLRLFLATLKQIPLFAGELPHRGYDIRSLTPVDYGGNPLPEGNGWSGLDVGRLLLSLHNLKACHPQYQDTIDQILLDWSYLRVINQQRLHNTTVIKSGDRLLPRVNPVDFLGYEELSARGFQLWGFEVNQSLTGKYETTNIEGLPIVTNQKRINSQPENQYTVSSPFVTYGLWLGLNETMKPIITNLLEVQARRFQKTGTLTSSDTNLIASPPYVITSAIIGKGNPWAVIIDNNISNEGRITSSGVAFAYHALFPNHEYAQKLWQSVVDLYNPNLGYFEGFKEENGERVFGFSSNTNSLVLQSLLYSLVNQPLLVNKFNLNSPWWQNINQQKLGNGLPTIAQPQIKYVNTGKEQYWTSLSDKIVSQEMEDSDKDKQEEEEEELLTDANNNLVESSNNISPSSSLPSPSSPPSPPSSPSPPSPVSKLTISPQDRESAQIAWQYFLRNNNPSTGFTNAVEDYPWVTLWDLGSHFFALHCAYQLDLITSSEFTTMMDKSLQSLSALPLSPITKLPNKAYSTISGKMVTLNNKPDPKGQTGWSVLDLARLMISLRVIYNHYPNYQGKIDAILKRWQLSKIVKDGWLMGGRIHRGKLILVQEGRLGYEQYAAHALKLWGISANQALFNPPIKTEVIEGVKIAVDQRNFANSNASNYLTNDPFLLWGMEMGWEKPTTPTIEQLLTVQKNRYNRTKILTAVNEDSLDRPPYFLYYSIYADGKTWTATNNRKPYPQYRSLSTKAAFAWNALKPNDSYTQKLREKVENLKDKSKGYFAGRFENPSLGVNKSLNINTNAVILESLLYKIRQTPLVR